MILLQTPPTSMNNFFDVTTLGTLAVASTAVVLICNAIQTAFNFNPKWLALAISIVYSYVLVLIKPPYHTVDFFLAFLNGLLTWATATGANVMTSRNGNPGGGSGFVGHIGRNRQFRDSWF